MADRQLQRLLQYGADLTGVSVAGAAEFLQAVPAGSGGLIATTVGSVLKEIAARNLSRRERARVAAATTFAAERIRVRLLAGNNPRDDGFFDDQEHRGSSGIELLESTLLRARDSCQERKVRHIGLFYANLVFTSEVSPETAHFLLRQMDRLTYRQLVLLALVGSVGSLDAESLRRQTHTDSDLEVLKREEMDLHATDLGTMGLLASRTAWVDELSPLGRALYDLGGFGEIAQVEIDVLRCVFESATPWVPN